MKKKKYWKENFSLNLRAHWKASKDYCLEYIWETSVSTLRLVQYYNGSKYERTNVWKSDLFEQQ